MALFRDDDQLAEEFEQLLRSGSYADNLQDQLKNALQWTEGRLLTNVVVKQIESNARHTLRRFLEEQPPYTVTAGHRPSPDCAADLTVSHDGQGRITIELPNEVRRWLLQTQSMICS